MSLADVKGPLELFQGAFDMCALGRIRTCNLLIRSQMLYPLSYECLGVLLCLLFLPGFSDPVGVAGTTLHDWRREVKSVCRTRPDLRKRPDERPRGTPRDGNDRSPGRRGPGLRDRGAEAEGFEPSMGFKSQTALAVRRHRPD